VAVYYIDSSGLVKRYVSEAGSTWVRSLFDPALNNEVFIAVVTSVEMIAAITRRTRAGTVSPADAAAACSRFRSHLVTGYQTVQLTDPLLQRAMSIAETHGLRAYDFVQLDAAIEVHGRAVAAGVAPVTLVSADVDLNAAALVEGLTVENPNAHP